MLFGIVLLYQGLLEVSGDSENIYCNSRNVSVNIETLEKDMNTLLKAASQLNAIVPTNSAEPDAITRDHVLDFMDLDTADEYRTKLRQCMTDKGNEYLPRSIFDLNVILFKADLLGVCPLTRIVHESKKTIVFGEIKIPHDKVEFLTNTTTHLLIQGTGDDTHKMAAVETYTNLTNESDFDKCNRFAFVCVYSPALTVDSNVIGLKIELNRAKTQTVTAVKRLLEENDIDYRFQKDQIKIYTENREEVNKNQCIKTEANVKFGWNSEQVIPQFYTPNNKDAVTILFSNLTNILKKAKVAVKGLRMDLQQNLGLKRNFFSWISVIENFSLDIPCNQIILMLFVLTIVLILFQITSCTSTVQGSRYIYRNLASRIYESVPTTQRTRGARTLRINTP